MICGKGRTETMMENERRLATLDAIHTRYSCRAFTDEMPPQEALEAIAQAALASPSARNRQPWRVVMVQDRELIAEMDAEGMNVLAATSDKSTYERMLSRGGKLYYNTPCMVMIPVDGKNTDTLAWVDCGIVSQNISLAAASMGIDSLICGLARLSFAGKKGEAFKQRLHFPEGFEFGMAVLLGYAEKPGGRPHIPDAQKLVWVR